METQTAGRQAVKEHSSRGSKSANCVFRDQGDCRARSQNCEKQPLASSWNNSAPTGLIFMKFDIRLKSA